MEASKYAALGKNVEFYQSTGKMRVDYDQTKREEVGLHDHRLGLSKRTFPNFLREFLLS